MPPSLLGEVLARIEEAGGRLRSAGRPGEYWIDAWEGNALSHAVELRLDDPVALQTYLLSLHDDAAVLWPGTPVASGALNLLLVHLEEALLAHDDVVAIEVRDRGLAVERGDAPGTP